MPRTKNSKSKRRASAAARTADAKRAAAQPATGAGPITAPKAPPGQVRGRGEHTTLAATKGAPAGLIPARPARWRGKAAAEAPGGTTSGAPPASTPDDAPGWAAKALAEMLTVTCWLDPGEHGDPFSATIRFSGRRAETTGKPQPGDTFAQEETVDGIVPGSGPVAVTAEVRGIHPGQWAVTARPVSRAGGGASRYRPPGGHPAGARRVPAPRRVVIPADSRASVRTAPLMLTKVPGIIRYAFVSLVSLGVLAGLGLEALLLAASHYPVLRPVLLSAAAVAAGIAGGKAWFIAVHRGWKFDGWCIQGFITGVAAVVAAAAVAGTGVPAGAYLGAAGPALLIGMAIGRPGCFWAGCCTGRPTASRRGIWSSDRRVGCRREPAQLLEALAALVIGVAVLAATLLAGLHRAGPVAVAGLAAYTLSRQFILGLRSEPPLRWRYGRQVTAVAAAATLIASVALLARG
jgi:phosphatidylglycerol---prolipoprotein diacylglyceryl transferase